MSQIELKPAVTSVEDEARVYAMWVAGLQGLVNFLNAAIELNLFDIISNPSRPLSATEIASHLPEQNPEKTPFVLDGILHLFAAFSLLDCTTESAGNYLDAGGSKAHRFYALSRAGKYFVKNRKYKLKDAITEGANPCYITYGMPIYQVMSQHPATNELFNTAMDQKTKMTMKLLIETYDGFDGVKVLVDVGGGNGASLKSIISANPHIKGVNFDLPHVLKDAQPIPGMQRLLGIIHVGGDFFAGILKGDAIMLKNVLHNWGDQKCIKLLKSCYEVLPAENGKAVVIEIMMPSDALTGDIAKLACLVDCVMFNSLDMGAGERSEEEFFILGRAACFSEVEAVCLVDGSSWVIEFRK